MREAEDCLERRSGEGVGGLEVRPWGWGTLEGVRDAVGGYRGIVGASGGMWHQVDLGA